MGVIYISATVGAALKKLAVALLSNKKVLKTIGGIILGIVIIIIMPVIAVISIFNGDINLNTDELQQIVEQRMTTEQKEKDLIVSNELAKLQHEGISGSKLISLSESGHGIVYDQLQKFNSVFMKSITEKE